MTQSIILATAANCSVSPSNVRTQSDPTADAQLEVNIAARGIIQNLIGTPVARKKGHYRIVAGGRRLERVHALIEKGAFTADYQVPLLVVPDSNDATELSLTENIFKLDMNPADTCWAFQDIIENEGKTPADVAKRFGLTERFVQGRLRLAGLAEPIFEALRNAETTLDVAIAYASTSDTTRQANVFEQLAHAHYRGNVHEIRRLLSQGSYKGGDPKALLVGRDAYVEAGGRIESDLFSDAAHETWLDGALLDQLADAKLAAAAEELRQREGFAAVRTVPARYPGYSETFGLRQLDGTPVPLSAEEDERQRAIEVELQCIEQEAADAGEYSEDQESRIEALEEELGLIQDRPATITDDQRASALAYLVIGSDGQPIIHEQLYVAPVQSDEDEPTGDDEDDAEDKDETGAAEATEEPAKPAISQRLADELAMMKTEMLALHVANDAGFAFTLAAFFMADRARRPYGSADLPTELRANAPSPKDAGYESETRAAREWTTLDQSLDQSWTEHYEATERYDAFCALDPEQRAAWFSWAIARTLDAIPAGKTGSAMIDHLGARLGIDVASWWRPTARCYFDRIPKATILDLFEDIGGAELRHRYASAKKHDLAASAEKLFAGELIVEAEVKQRALAWLPDEMRFANAVLAQADADDGDDGSEVVVEIGDVGEGAADEPATDQGDADEHPLDRVA